MRSGLSLSLAFRLATIFVAFVLEACGQKHKTEASAMPVSVPGESRPTTSAQPATESPAPITPEGGYSLTIVGGVLPGGRVQLNIVTNIPGTIEVMAGVSLAGQKPDDPYIGIDEKVSVPNGSGSTILDVSHLPKGQYEAEATFYPRWGFKDEQARRTGITESLEAKQSITLSGSGESAKVVELRKRGQGWVMDNIIMGTRWDPADWRRRFGQPVEVTVERWNPAIIKGYYFPSIDVTVFVNVPKDEVSIWRLGRASS